MRNYTRPEVQLKRTLVAVFIAAEEGGEKGTNRSLPLGAEFDAPSDKTRPRTLVQEWLPSAPGGRDRSPLFVIGLFNTLRACGAFK